MESLSRPQLSAMCKLLEMSVFGTDSLLRWRIINRLETLKADDILIDKEGITSLSFKVGRMPAFHVLLLGKILC